MSNFNNLIESHISEVDTKNKKDDEDFKKGDLGLGNGLKPGSLSSGNLNTALKNKPTKVHRKPHLALSRTESYSSLSSENSDSDGCSVGDGEQQKTSKLSQFFSRKSSEGVDLNEDFPTYANVPYGTTIHQQKRLFHHDLEKIINKNMPCEEVCTDEHCTLCGSNSSATHFHKSTLAADIEHRLYKAQCEIDELQTELENCTSRLQAKYRAIDILRKQAEYCEREYEEVEQRASEYSHQLEKPLQLACVTSEVMGAQPNTWWRTDTDKFLRDNAMLTSKLKSQTEELSRVSRENIGLKRERDELLALIDVQDKSRYERSRSTSGEDLYNNYTSAELAVLGACSCRGTKPDPCGCAHAAVKLKKDSYRLLDQLQEEKQRQKEGERTVEAYRVAFNEQLERNKTLALKVAEVGAPINRHIDKTKHILKWVMQSIRDDDAGMGDGYKLNALLIADIDTTKFTDRQLLLLLIDMMNERSELRAHQKLASSIIKRSLAVDDLRDATMD